MCGMIIFYLYFVLGVTGGRGGWGGFDFLILLYNQNLYNQNLYNQNRSPILPSLLLLRGKASLLQRAGRNGSAVDMASAHHSMSAG